MLTLPNPSCPLTAQIQARYIKFQQSARLPKRLAVKASPPLLVCPHERWHSARAKLLIVEQETRRWMYNPGEVGDLDDPIENFWEFSRARHGVGAMWNLYRWYALGRVHPKLNSPFWRGFRAIDSVINGAQDAALWTNVFKVNANGSVMTNCKAAGVAALQSVGDHQKTYFSWTSARTASWGSQSSPLRNGRKWIEPSTVPTADRAVVGVSRRGVGRIVIVLGSLIKSREAGAARFLFSKELDSVWWRLDVDLTIRAQISAMQNAYERAFWCMLEHPGVFHNGRTLAHIELPFLVAGPGSNLADHTLLQVTSGAELIIAGSTGNGYRLAELMGATNPSGRSGVLKVKNPAGVTAGYILLYSNP